MMLWIRRGKGHCTEELPDVVVRISIVPSTMVRSCSCYCWGSRGNRQLRARPGDEEDVEDEQSDRDEERRCREQEQGHRHSGAPVAVPDHAPVHIPPKFRGPDLPIPDRHRSPYF
jgi:hypothetical protein